MGELYLVRHGQVEYNKTRDTIEKRKNQDDRNQDEHLTKVGKEQIEGSAEELKDKKIDLCICSPYNRTKETAKIILKYHPGVKIIYDDRIKEMNIEYDMTMKDRELLDKTEHGYPSELPDYGMGYCKHIYDRVKSILDDIYANYRDKNILIVSHSGIIRMCRDICYRDGNRSVFDFFKPNSAIKNGEVVYLKIKKPGGVVNSTKKTW